MNVDAIRGRLDRSRAALLAALEGVTERDFATELEPGVTVIAALAALAPAEREAIRQARLALGAPERPLPGGGTATAARATPPQVVHDLAGARYETALFLDLLAGQPTPDDTALTAVRTLLEAIADREGAAAGAIEARISRESAHSA